ncbi:hypothetical protein GGF50DRAFT_119114 [Schizophyllum commune]
MSAMMDATEQAANVTSEFINSLDNLPKEVQHLCAEIRERDARVQSLNAEITKMQHLFLRRAQPEVRLKIDAAYADVFRLSDEKVALALRLQDRLFRTTARADGELLRVRKLTGEIVEPPAIVTRAATRGATGLGGSVSVGGVGGGAGGAIGGWGSPSPSVGAIEGILQAAVEDAAPATASRRGAPRKRTESRDGTPDAGQPQTKRRRHTSLAGTPTQIRLDSPMPAQASASTGGPGHQRSRLSRQVAQEPDEDEDAEGEEDEEEDQTLYCLCRMKSHGDMIGCDNDECPYQWFHLSCVNLKPPLPDQWFCPDCLPKMKRRKR